MIKYSNKKKDEIKLDFHEIKLYNFAAKVQ